MNHGDSSLECLTLLAELLLGSDGADDAARPMSSHGSNGLAQAVAGFDPRNLSELWSLAMSHHVILRSFPLLSRLIELRSPESAERLNRAILKEEERVHHALSFLFHICNALEAAGGVVVIKSLDHWPDLGSDLDLYTNADAAEVVAIMGERFKARVDQRSWGDRLANKWNFIVPGLPELVEVHVARLGQTGEQIAITQSLIARSRPAQFVSRSFRVAAPEDRIVISTLQRMYRHFYIRLCDMVDNLKLVESGEIDYPYLRSLAMAAGLWDGLATYLVIVSGYVESYRGRGLPLPPLVTDAARFGNELIRFKRNFLRVPIFPQSVGFYASEWKTLLLKGDFRSTLRLSLLPGLATAAALELKVTGSDKGIW
ncbi:MAG TPA: hypothetical protein VK641_04475 [Terriglobales bacterium]|jgi:hypothetical protein|nr:hypothetical protein [Terriglobales bacterium]